MAAIETSITFCASGGASGGKNIRSSCLVYISLVLSHKLSGASGDGIVGEVSSSESQDNAKSSKAKKKSSTVFLCVLFFLD